MIRLNLPAKLADSVVVALAVLGSAVLYLPYLGFYSDDWSFLWYVGMGGPEPGLGDIYSRTMFLTDSIMTRPAHALYAATLLALFGDQPLGHHAVNTAVLALSGALFYLLLRELGQWRLPALAAALLYVLLPHYMTDRFWFVTFQVPLSAATYFLSLLADLRAAARPAGQRTPLRILSMIALVTSVLSYEIFMPLFFLNPLIVWHRMRGHGPQRRIRWPELAAFALLQGALLIAAGAFKAAYTARLVSATLADHVTWFAKLLAEGFYTLLLGDFGLRLPLLLWDIAIRHDVAAVLVAGLACGVLIFLYLRSVARAPDGELPSRAISLRQIGAGALIFPAGYSIFFVTFTAGIATTGMNNRTAMAAAMGIAVAATGALGWLAGGVPAAWRVKLFAAATAALCAIGFTLINTTGLYWGAAAATQRKVLAGLRQDVPTLPPGTALLLDGVCPYVGPAPVFETWWDFSSALRLVYNDNSLVGDVVKPGIEIAAEGIYTRMYGKRIGPYRYETLYVYDARGHRLQRLAAAHAARSYFAPGNAPPGRGCRASREGEGERLFVPGARRIGFPPRAEPL